MSPTSLLSGLLALCPLILAQAATPVLKHIFSAQVDLGSLVGPVPIVGGVLAVEPIIGGTINGTALNGTISSGGIAAVSLSSNATVANPSIDLFGKTDDGVTFVVTATGVGQQGAQFARVVVNVGGKYAYLADEFILATFTDNKAVTVSTIEAWAVSRGG